MNLLIDDHFQKEWFHRCLSASEKGIDHIDTLGILSLEEQMEEFYNESKDKIPPYHTRYEPNPFRFQYDLLVHCWLHYHSILDREIKLNKEKSEELTLTQNLYGITREDFLFAAAELRWPTTQDKDGARRGKFVRDPWSERRVQDYSHPKIKYTASFGGGGQGKTTTFSAFSVMMFDHYLFTEKGARCMISTTAKDKLNSVAWPYVTTLYKATEQGISLYAGRGEIKGEWTIKRPGNKDTAGVFKGLLLGNQINNSSVEDKLTGSHGHPFISYLLDEAQSTSKAPMVAANNFTMHARDYRISLAGNYSEDEDTLGENTKPKGGWTSVDENTEYWETKTATGQPIIVRHFNNNNSPGMGELSKVFPHMPSKRNLEEKYPNPSSRTMNNIGYRRFWVGFRTDSLDNDLVITDEFVKENNANQPLILHQIESTFFSFDSAPAEIDRNVQLICKSGLCPKTKQRIFGPSHIYILPKTTESIRYYRESSASLLSNAHKNNIKSGAAIVDWTGRPGHAEHLDQAGFTVQRIVYNKGLPDGQRIDTITKRKERPIRLGITVDFQKGIPVDKLCAHHVSETCIDFSALLLRLYIQAGRLRGLNEDLIKNLSLERSWDEEVYKRKFRYKTSVKYGDRFVLQSKKEFKELYGFSPDIFDSLLQMCYYAFVYLKIPLTSIDSDVNLKLQDTQKIEDDVNEVWDSINAFDDEMAIHISEGQPEHDDYWNQF